MTVERKACTPRKLALTSKYIAPYWFTAMHNVFQYSKRRQLQEVHKLVDDSRIKKGRKLYLNKHIIKNVVTKHNNGDVLATVLSEDKKTEHTVIIKNYLPDKLPQFMHEREEFIANLYIDCDCKDHLIGHYKDNCSLMCKHVNAVLWFLIEKFDMPRIFIVPEIKISGFKKSETVELETNIEALPLIKFRSYINVLLLKRFRGVKPALGLSIHTISNDDQKEHYQPKWLTYVNHNDVLRLIKGSVKAYKVMAKADDISDDETEKTLCKALKISGKPTHWTDEEIHYLQQYYPKDGSEIPQLLKTRNHSSIRQMAKHLGIKTSIDLKRRYFKKYAQPSRWKK